MVVVMEGDGRYVGGLIIHRTLFLISELYNFTRLVII